MELKKISNKKGDIPSLIYAISVLFAIGVILFFFSHIFGSFYTEFDNYFAEQERYNNTEVHDTIKEIESVEKDSRIWDYGFLAFYVSYILILGFTAFSTRISPIFYWVYVIVAMLGLFLGTMLSNMWQEIAIQPTFVETITRFPITNALLGTYYPTAVTVLIVIFIILIFGKPLSGGEQ